jgi:MFS family permease
VGGGLLPLLPVYAMRLGASRTTVGAYLASSYLALAAGTIVAGWISDRTQRRKVWLIAAGAMGMPALWLMGQVTTIGQLAALTAAI